MLRLIAEADGQVTADELKKLESYVDERLKLQAKERKLAIKVFEDAADSPLEIRDYAKKFRGRGRMLFLFRSLSTA